MTDNESQLMANLRANNAFIARYCDLIDWLLGRCAASAEPDTCDGGSAPDSLSVPEPVKVPGSAVAAEVPGD